MHINPCPECGEPCLRAHDYPQYQAADSTRAQAAAIANLRELRRRERAEVVDRVVELTQLERAG